MKFATTAILLAALLGCLTTTTTTAFVPTTTTTAKTTTIRRPPTAVFMSDNKNDDDSSLSSNKKPFDEKLRSKLVSEAIAPWRTVRLFMYGTLGSSALVGGLITAAGTAAALQGLRPDLDLNEQYKNLAIDFGAVLVFAVLAKFDVDKQRELDDNVQSKIAKTKQRKVAQKSLAVREQQLGQLQLDIQIGTDRTQTATIRELQAGARQHLIVIVGPRKACRDALIGANLLKMEFALSNVLVVPYETDADPLDASVRPKGTGFGGDSSLPMYETQPYVARPAGDGWDEWCAAEMADAVAQNGPQTAQEGVAIVVENTGKVMRRGIGKVPWRQMVEQLDGTGGSRANKPATGGFFS